MANPQYTARQVIERTEQLKANVGNRNDRMNDYELMYRLQMWRDVKKPDEVRVTLPTAFDLIEKSRALLITRPPAISVPTTSTNPDEQERAQHLERFLYGMSERINLPQHFSDAEWNALCLGDGHLKLMWDPYAAYDEFPLVCIAPDPRTIYGTLNPQQDRYMELAQSWLRSRREIEAEFPAFTFHREPTMDFAGIQAWMDEKVEFIEYWREETTLEKVEPEIKEEPPKTIVERAAEMLMQKVAADANVPEIDATIKAAAPEADEKLRKRRVRHIYHMVVVNDMGSDGEPGIVVKPPTEMMGYKRIPFFSWSGISTPMAGKNRGLSLLFALSNGDAGEDAYGVLAAMSILASIDLESAIKEPHAPVITDDANNRIDMMPDAINYVAKDSKVSRLAPVSANPALGRSIELMKAISEQVGIPNIWNGQPQSLSGQAISGFANAYQMMLGFRQRQRERALQALFSCALSLVAEFADDEDGVRAYGNTATGKFVEETVTPDEVGTEMRVTVKLSALQPKDDIGMLSILSMLQTKGQISMETFLDQVQKLIGGLAADSPLDEIERVLRDRILMDPDMSKNLALTLARGYQDLLTGRAGGISQSAIDNSKLLATPQSPPPGLPFMPQGAPAPQGPPQGGMPPGMSITPDMVAGAGNTMGAQNMLAGQQVMPQQGMPMPQGVGQ